MDLNRIHSTNRISSLIFHPLQRCCRAERNSIALAYTVKRSRQETLQQAINRRRRRRRLGFVPGRTTRYTRVYRALQEESPMCNNQTNRYVVDDNAFEDLVLVAKGTPCELQQLQQQLRCIKPGVSCTGGKGSIQLPVQT